MAKTKKKFYVVWKGRREGIYDNWPACREQIQGYSGAQYKSFATRAEAEAACEGYYQDYAGKKERPTRRRPADLLEKITTPSLAVDAACTGNPGAFEYRGVDVESGEEIFHVGPYAEGTNNIGEFLALVHGLAYLKAEGKSMPIYTDSRTALAWLKKKKIKTTLKANESNRVAFAHVEKAIRWLEENEYETEILKWDTEQWGEIPADFGRK